MTFAARTQGPGAGGGSALNSTFTVVTDNGFNTYGRGSFTSYFYGWCPYVLTQGSTYPDAAIGSCSTASPGLGILVVKGCYSTGLNIYGWANTYTLLLAGNVTTGLTSLTVAGTSMGAPYSYVYDAANNATRVTFTPTAAATKFGTSSGANITVVIA